MLLIHFTSEATRVKTDGFRGLAQPLLKLVSPTSFHLPSLDIHWRGPPESPKHVLLPPAAYPAHI